VSACPSPSLGSSCPAEGPYLLCSDGGIFWPSSWRAPSCRQVQGSVGSNTGSSTASTAREVVASQNRPGEHEKKSKGVAVAEKCSRSDGAEEWVRLKNRSVAARLHVTRLLHRMPPGSAILRAFGGLAHQSAKRAYVSRQLFVRQAAICRVIPHEGSQEVAVHACIQDLLIPQQFCRLN
jgi:hypothetical protein